MAEDRFLEDFRVGERSVSGGVTMTEGGIIHFALLSDPQSFHLDVTAAKKSPYGGLIANGFHTLSLCFRPFMQRGVLAACSMGSPGIDEVRRLAPVRPGDTLRTETEVLEVKPSASKPDRNRQSPYRSTHSAGSTRPALVVNLTCHRPAGNRQCGEPG